jgi:hypothetical protein
MAIKNPHAPVDNLDQGSPDTADLPSESRSGLKNVTPRAFALGLLFALLICAILPYNDYFIGATFLSGNFLPVGSIFAILLMAMVVNPALIAMKRRDRIFTFPEIITIWAMIVVVAGIPSSGLMRYLIPHIVAPYYFADTSNGWIPLILIHVPHRLFVTDPYAVSTFFNGLGRGRSVPWRAWAEPLSLWSIFVFLLYALFFSLSAIVRRQWIENDRLAFPLVRLPLLISETPEDGQYLNSFLRSPLLWIAVALVTCLHTIKGLHLFYPVIPDITTTIDLSSLLTVRPWDSLSNTFVGVFPLIIGIAYLLSTEVCFSLWFFYLLFKLQTVIGTVLSWDMSQAGSGINMGPGFAGYQEAGGAVVVALWLVVSMRTHLKTVLHKAITDDPAIDDSNEALSYRAAVIGTASALAGLFVWMVYVAAVDPLMAVAVLFGALCIFVMLSWLVAQAGLFFTQQSFAPSQIASALAGPTAFNTSTLMMATLTEQVAWYDARELMMPSILNSYKTARESGLSARSLTRALIVCVVLAVFVSGAASVWLPYTHGGALALPDVWMYLQSPQIPLGWTAAQVTGSNHSVPGLLPDMAAGALFVLSLVILRGHFAGFSLHPAGFLIASTYPMYEMWFSLLIGYMIKAPILRYGGIKLYRTALPFFMGLILGDCLNAVIWTIVGLITKTGYRLLPG